MSDEDASGAPAEPNFRDALDREPAGELMRVPPRFSDQENAIHPLFDAPPVLVAESVQEPVGASPPDGLLAAIAHAQAMEARGGDDVLARWIDIHERFPKSNVAFRFRVRSMARERLFPEIVDLVEVSLPGEPLDFEPLLLKAELLKEGRAYQESQGLFEKLLHRFPERVEGRISFAKFLKGQGKLKRAFEVVSLISPANRISPRSRALVDEIRAGFAALEMLCPGQITDEGNSHGLALEQVILRYTRRYLPPLTDNRLGAAALITGGLGAGGAERQMARLAVHLEKARRRADRSDQVRIDGPVEVIVKSCGDDQDFFLPELNDVGVPVREMDAMEPLAITDLGIDDPVTLALAECLPQRALFGVKRLVAHFRRSRTEVALIWQDGAVLIAALAALVAQVPRVLITLRGMPPNLREHLARPEYERMYRALGEVPGVEFFTNCRAAALAYSQWLGWPEHRFKVIHNGVDAPACDPTFDDERAWDAFRTHTVDSNLTVGTVFRFDTDKRPLLWVKTAHRYLKRNPGARFVMVGSGRLFDESRDLALELGIGDRILFTGRSRAVGYWLSKMDVLLLTSRHEGLPNVLVEAQLMGIPVVSTPAGGAGECFLHGKTGLMLSNAEFPDLDEACTLIDSLRVHPDPIGLKANAQAFARSGFSVASMVDAFAAAMAGTPRPINMPHTRTA
jgi:glycosyltransferase involved in cell wall biosynthesis